VILDVKGIDTYYGLGHILHGLSLNVAEGEVVALLGRNGAGKTTTLRSVTGLTPPKRGEILYKGRNIAGLDAHKVSRMGIALVPETRGIFSYLSTRENLDIARRKGSRWQLDTVLERFPALRERLDSKGRSLSGGEQEMLAIARALVTGPDLLLLDEPITGLDLGSQQRILDLIAVETMAGTSVVLSTHHLGEARHTDRVLLLAGCVMADGAPEEVLKPQLLAEAFGNRMVRTDAGAVVIDDHGHDDADHRHGVDASDLIPQHRHDHARHDHRPH
jgi:branched-chain amino acid transport system ATP-binding protein